MRILVLSDSHGHRRTVNKILEAQPTADIIIHLGDGAADLEFADLSYPHKTFRQVVGNCDFTAEFPTEECITVHGHKIFFTHGHHYRVKYTLDDLLKKARWEQAEVVLFGHTHHPETGYDEGIYYMNPGAVENGCYGIVDITDKGIVTLLARI